MRKLIISTFLLIFTMSITAQNSIHGKVVDENNNPLSKAVVKLLQTKQSALTNEKGEFEFRDLKDFAYSLTVKYIGFETYEQIIKTGSTIIVQMKPLQVQLEDVIVVATRATASTPVAFTNVSKKQIDERNSGQDLPYLLMLTPSFVSTSDAGTGIGYTGFRIRGTDANRTNVTINGIPYNDSESHNVYFVDMPDFASSLSSVQIQRGVGTSTNGASAFGASINLLTEKLNPIPYAETGVSFGSFGTMKKTLKVGSGLINNFAIDARLSDLVSDGYIDRASVKMKSYFVSAGYYGDKTLVKFITFGGNENTYIAWKGVDFDNYPRTYNDAGQYTDNNGKTKFYSNQIDNFSQYHYQLHLTQLLTSSLTMNAALHYTRGEGYYEEYKTDRNYLEYGLTPAVIDGVTLKKTDLVRQKWLDNHFGGATFALNYNKEKYTLTVGGAANKYFGDHYGKVIWVRNPNNIDVDHQYYFNKSTKTDANVYTKLNYHFTDNLLAYIDLQYRFILLKMNGEDDKYDAKKAQMRLLTSPKPFHFFNPKLGLSYEIDPVNSIFASIAVANREPNRSNYTDAGLNDKPTSERLYDTELGYNYKSSNFNIGTNLYFMKYKNQLVLSGKYSEIGEALTSNIPHSYRAGIELIAGIQLVDGFRWEGNLNISQNKIQNFTEYAAMYDADRNWIGTKENYFEKTDISYSPNVVANSVFSYTFKGFETALYSTYVGKQYLDNTANNDRSINAYFVNNLRVGYSFELKKIKEIGFNLLINNLLNSKYETNGYNDNSYYLDGKRVNEKRYFPQAGINFLFSTTLKF